MLRNMLKKVMMKVTEMIKMNNLKRNMKMIVLKVIVMIRIAVIRLHK